MECINFVLFKNFFLVLVTLLHKLSHIHTLSKWLLYKVPTCSPGTHKQIFTYRYQEHHRAQYLSHRHFNMQTGGVWDQTKSSQFYSYSAKS